MIWLLKSAAAATLSSSYFACIKDLTYFLSTRMRSILGHEYARFCISRREAILILTLWVARDFNARRSNGCKGENSGKNGVSTVIFVYKCTNKGRNTKRQSLNEFEGYLAGSATLMASM